VLTRESSTRRANRVARTTRKAKATKRRDHDKARPYERPSDHFNLTSALEEWALDYEGTHSIFED
jgi:hypothetical protein